jgi:hypothetical protein
MIFENFQGKSFATGPAAEFDAFSGPVQKKLPVAFGAGGSVSYHICLVTIRKRCSSLFQTGSFSPEYSGGSQGCQMDKNARGANNPRDEGRNCNCHL